MAESPHPTEKRRRLRPWLKPLLAFCSFLAALAICEVAVRAFSLAPEVKAIWISNEKSPDVVYRRSTDPLLGFELKPDYRNANPDHRTTYDRTNSHGQRDIERTVAKPAGVRRVIILGDSVVEGHGLPDLDLTISRQLEKLYVDHKTEVLNFGVSGYCTRSEIELLETKGLQFEPDVVIVVFVENDFNNFSPEAFQLGTATDRPAVVKHLFLDSHLFRLGCVKFNLFRFGEDADPLAWNQRAIGENNVVTGFERLRQLAGEHHFHPLIAVWPHFADTEIQNLPLMEGGSGDLVVERVAAVFGLPTVRLSTAFEANWKSLGGKINPREYYSVEGDQLHPNEKAAIVAAESLKTILNDLDAGKFAMREPIARDAKERSIAVEEALSLGKSNAPDYSMVYVNEGQAHEKSGNLAAAEDSYRKALEADPDSFPALNNLGVLAAKQGRLQDAVSNFEQALALRPNSPDIHNNLGNLYLAANRFDVAEKHFEDAIRIRPDYAEAHYNYGTVLSNKNDSANAQVHLRRAIELDPRYVKAYHNLAVLLATNGDLPGAIEQFRRAVEIDPKYAPGHANLGHLLFEQKQYDQAEAAYMRALQVDPNMPDVQQGLAALQQLRKPTGAK